MHGFAQWGISTGRCTRLRSGVARCCSVDPFGPPLVTYLNVPYARDSPNTPIAGRA